MLFKSKMTPFLFIGVFLFSNAALCDENKSVKCENECRKTADAINKASKAVVNLHVSQTNKRDVFNPFMGDPTFDFFFGGQMQQPQITMGSGSGVIVNTKGLVVTCAHVVKDAEKILVKLNDGREFEASILYQDSYQDIALLSIITTSSEEFPVAQLGDSDDLVITEPVYAIGNAFGIGQSITGGIISALNRVLDGNVLMQIDAAVNPGNSGGGLFNQRGQYVGVPNAIITKTGANHGVGFAKPIRLIKSIIYQVENKIQHKPVWIGISGQDFSYGIAKALDGFKIDDYKGGVMVTTVHEKSPFSDKVKPKDVILFVNDYTIDNVENFDFRVKTTNLKDDITLTIWRKDTGIQTITEKLPSVPESERTISIEIKGNNLLSGYVITDVTEFLISSKNLPHSLKGKTIILQTPEKYTQQQIGFARYIQQYDEIIKINGKEISKAQQVADAIAKGLISITMRRGNQIMQFSQNG